MERPLADKRPIGPFAQSSSASNNNMFLEVVLDRSQSVSLMLDDKIYPNRKYKNKLKDNEDQAVVRVGTQLAIDILSKAEVADYDIDPERVVEILDPVDDKDNIEIASVNGKTLSIVYEVSTLSPNELADLIITIRQLDVTVNDIKWV